MELTPMASRAARAVARTSGRRDACMASSIARAASETHRPDGPAWPRQTSRCHLARYACAMTDLEDALAAIDTWGAEHAAVAVVASHGILASHGDPDHVFRWASVTKLATALTVL